MCIVSCSFPKRSKTKKSVDGARENPLASYTLITFSNIMSSFNADRATTGDVTANLHLQHPESNFSLTGISALVYLRGLLGDLLLIDTAVFCKLQNTRVREIQRSQQAQRVSSRDHNGMLTSLVFCPSAESTVGELGGKKHPRTIAERNEGKRPRSSEEEKSRGGVEERIRGGERRICRGENQKKRREEDTKKRRKEEEEKKWRREEDRRSKETRGKAQNEKQ
eukprot:763998-Hanusia_phi.AAC.1